MNFGFVARGRLPLSIALVCGGAIVVSAWGVGNAAGSSGKARLVRVGGSFNHPIYVASTTADLHAIYVVERGGRIWIVRHGHRVRRPFLDIHRDITLAANSEQGLLSMAFAPDYAKSRIYYIYYSNRQGNIRVKQFHRSKTDPNRTAAGSGRTILALRHPQINHYGGQLQFGPDGDLYIGIGDGGGVGDPSNHAQTLNNLFGKILRIDPSRPGRHHPYRIPRGNPFVHRPGARPEIFAYGLRNPWRFSFDSKTGAVWIGDVGENSFEEVDYRRRGRLAGTNFGWSRFEGFSQFSNRAAPGAVFPVIVEAHSGGTAGSHETWCALMGGYVVRDPTLRGLYGRYLFADHCMGSVFSARISKRGRAFDVGPTGITVGGLPVSFGVDALQRVYICSLNGGAVYRFVAR
jgi:hypothetical protein